MEIIKKIKGFAVTRKKAKGGNYWLYYVINNELNISKSFRVKNKAFNHAVYLWLRSTGDHFGVLMSNGLTNRTLRVSLDNEEQAVSYSIIQSSYDIQEIGDYSEAVSKYWQLERADFYKTQQLNDINQEIIGDINGLIGDMVQSVEDLKNIREHIREEKVKNFVLMDWEEQLARLETIKEDINLIIEGITGGVDND